MAWAYIAPDFNIPAVDLRPVASITQEAPTAELISAFRAACTEIKARHEVAQLGFRAHAFDALARLTSAKLDGRSVDCSGFVSLLDGALKDARKDHSALEKAMRGFVSRVTKLRIPGANTTASSMTVLSGVLSEWRHDLEDFREEFARLNRLMLKDRETALVTRALRAYARAITKIVGVETSIPSGDEDEFTMPPSIDMPMPDDVRGSRAARRDILSKVHSVVAEEDERLVGLVAINYVSQMAE